MRVNEVISRCMTDQKVEIHYEGSYIIGMICDIIPTELYRENRIGDMLVTKINTYDNALYLKAVKA